MSHTTHLGIVPEFAIIGHPNEGKSSVLSTLAEDDSVRISPFPGETVVCQSFPVRIDGREVIRFIDTPGFQNPRDTLEWLKTYDGPPGKMLAAFRAAHANDPGFHDDCELLGPVDAGAGVIFVVDGSRPVRQVDLAEMEILRLTGAPRMAVINSKEDDAAYINQWQNEFRKNFNAVRLFNSSRANYRQRIELLESLKSIDQELEPVLRRVVQAFEEADNILRQAIRCIAELILTTGVINVDFADVTSIFRQSESSDALLGIGESDKGAVQSVQSAVQSPLIEKSLEGARGIILNISGNKDLSLYEVNEATRYIYEHTDPEVNIILGTVIDEDLGENVRATIIATDFVDGMVMKSPKAEVPQSKLAGSFSLDTPAFMDKAAKVPSFHTKSSFSVPSFHSRPDEKK